MRQQPTLRRPLGDDRHPIGVLLDSVSDLSGLDSSGEKPGDRTTHPRVVSLPLPRIGRGPCDISLQKKAQLRVPPQQRFLRCNNHRIGIRCEGCDYGFGISCCKPRAEAGQ